MITLRVGAPAAPPMTSDMSDATISMSSADRAVACPPRGRTGGEALRVAGRGRGRAASPTAATCTLSKPVSRPRCPLHCARQHTPNASRLGGPSSANAQATAPRYSTHAQESRSRGARRPDRGGGAAPRRGGPRGADDPPARRGDRRVDHRGVHPLRVEAGDGPHDGRRGLRPAGRADPTGAEDRRSGARPGERGLGLPPPRAGRPAPLPGHVRAGGARVPADRERSSPGRTRLPDRRRRHPALHRRRPADHRRSVGRRPQRVDRRARRRQPRARLLPRRRSAVRGDPGPAHGDAAPRRRDGRPAPRRREASVAASRP